MPEHFPRAMSSLGTVALTLSLATAALSEPTGDGRSGPATITGAAIDQALVALNGFLQARYQQEDRLAGLAAPPPQDFVTTAMATAAVPQMRSGVVSKFGVLVAGDLSLNDNVDYLNRYVLNRRTDLFVQVAKAAAGKGLDFAEVAMTSDCDTALLFYGSQLASSRLEFGILVSDDATLDQQVVAINSHIRDFGQREILLAQAVPVVPGKSFDLMVIAMLVTP